MIVPRESDIISGRGGRSRLLSRYLALCPLVLAQRQLFPGRCIQNPGNVYFRDVVTEKQLEYAQLPLNDGTQAKKRIVEALYDRFQREERRFLKQDEYGDWHILSRSEAEKKIYARVRDGLPQLRVLVQQNNDI